MSTQPSYTRIDIAAAARHRLSAELEAHLKDSKVKEVALRQAIFEADAALRVAAEGMNLEAIAAAERVLYIRGEYAKAGTDRAEVLQDAIAQIATGEKRGYRGLWHEAFGTKSYAHWYGQRSDHEYFFGPKHGSLIFQVGLLADIRSREVQELSDAEKEACVYYLTNLERIQAARQHAKAA